ncbi:MAG TPA: MATE family efflux transporter [Polyangiaceae bacterium]|nr:MATE family efflux transporter [Polyangiaceae bacterium]
MSQPRINHAQIPVVQLVWPLFVENILRTSLLSVDTLMLSRYSQKAVAAMSLVHQFAFFIQLIYAMVSIGASILISQNLGAGRRREAGLIGVGSLVLISGLSLVLSLSMLALAGPLMSFYRLDPEVATYATQFLAIFGGLSFFMALNAGQASIVRAWGYPRDSMWVNTICLLVTVAGNALCLFGPFGFPILGVVGVAFSNVLSQAVACVLYHWIIKHRVEIELPLRQIMRIPRPIYRAVLSVGIPTAGENLSYNVSQIAIYSMIAKMGTDALAAVGIVLALLRYVFMPGISIGSGAQIKVGYLVGAGCHDDAKARVYRYFAVGFLISVLLVAVIGLARTQLLGIFTHDPKLLAIAASVLLVAAIHEPGRNFNTIIIPALKGAGDVRFPVYVGIVSMWGISVLGAWLLGVHWGFGLVGIWIAMASDEWIRGLVMLWRWRSGAWKTKCLMPIEAPTSLSPASLRQSEAC